MKIRMKLSLPSRTLKVLLALLLCAACIPVQSLTFAKQAWAATAAPLSYAVYYQPSNAEGYTLVFQNTSIEDTTYGKKVGVIEVRDVRSGSTTHYGIGGGVGPSDGVYVREKKLAPKVTRVTVRDPFAVPYTMQEWFSGMENCTSFELYGIDASKVEQMGSAFSGCSSLEHLDLTPLSLKYLHRMEGTFKNCLSLRSITGITNNGFISTFNESFKNCRSLTSVDLSQMKIGTPTRFEEMFSGCSSLQRVTFPKTDAIGFISTMNMFKDCISLQNIDLSMFISTSNEYYNEGGDSVSRGSNMSGMFENCTSLKSVDLSHLSAKIGCADRMFAGCNTLRELSCPHIALGYSFKNLSTGHEDSATYIELFEGCHSLERMQIPAWAASSLPRPSNTSIPGATGNWITNNEGYLIPEIAQNDIQDEWVSEIPDSIYNGKPVEPVLNLKNGDRVLELGTDYVVEYRNNASPGTALAVISGRGIYTGSVTKTFNIKPSIETNPGNSGSSGSSNNSGNNSPSVPRPSNSPNANTPGAAISVSPSDISVEDAILIPGGTARPSITIVIGGVTLREGIDYSVRYSNVDKLGTATVTIIGKAPYQFSITKTFKVKPKAPSVKKLLPSKKDFTVKWTRLSASQADGYQVRYATKRSMKGAKKLTVRNPGKTSAKISRPKSGKVYYVQVRSYKKSDGKTFYSNWSTVKRFSNPPATTLSKVKTAKKGFKVTWKKQSRKWVSGYQVRWSTKKSMKGAKKISVKSAKRSSLKVSKLKGNKKYYVQVRTFKKAGKKTYYSSWSKAKAVKTKK
ncbi:leucine-rich repeat protein [Eggerthellaceae bacterium 24-137]